MEKLTLKEIAKFINGEVVGNGDVVISGIAGIREAEKGDLTFLANPKYTPLLEKTSASAIIVSRDDIISASCALIRVDNPSLAFVKAISLISPHEVMHPTGIHPAAILGKNVSLGRNVALGPYVVVGNNVSIGDNSIIYAHCFIGHDTKIGEGTIIYANVSIREDVSIGKRVIIHSGTVIGSDGFGFENVEGKLVKIPQIGTVEIGDDVEIGANVAIDRARFDKTVIGSGTKIDNLVQIAHNVVIGKNSIIVSQAGISGSTTLGDRVTLAGQVGVVGHIKIGDNAVVMAQAGVSKDVPADTAVWGYPAKPVEQAKRVNAGVQNLPRLYRMVNELKKKIEALEKRING